MISPQEINEQAQDTLQNKSNISNVVSNLVGSNNVGPLERWASGLGGGLIAFYGISRRDWLGTGLALVGGSFVYRGLAGHSYVYQALGMNTAKQGNNSKTSVRHNRGIKVERAVTINRSPDELYSYWRDFSNLPNFMDHLKSVKMTSHTRSYWAANAPAGASVEWDAEIINERKNELIAWRSLPGAQIRNAGSVHFTPALGNRGTVVKVVLEYEPPAGRLGSIVAKLFGEEPDQQVREDLRHFKEIMEAGEIPTTEGQSSGRSK